MDKYYFYFKVFDFKDSVIHDIYLSKAFFKQYNNYLKINQLPFIVEDAVAYYFVHMEKKKVDRFYLERSHLADLFINEDNVWIEVKSSSDKLSPSQLESLLSFKGKVFWVLDLRIDELQKVVE